MTSTTPKTPKHALEQSLIACKPAEPASGIIPVKFTHCSPQADREQLEVRLFDTVNIAFKPYRCSELELWSRNPKSTVPVPGRLELPDLLSPNRWQPFCPTPALHEPTIPPISSDQTCSLSLVTHYSTDSQPPVYIDAEYRKRSCTSPPLPACLRSFLIWPRSTNLGIVV